jgi:hypothetical protein
LLNALVLVGSLLLCELTLQLGSQLFPSVDAVTRSPWISRFIKDPRNGYRGNPAFTEHDDWGYRNDRRPAHADIITLGDSWTYGTVMERGAEWPAVLAELMNRDIYNMGMGGTGPVNYLQSFYQSLELRPKIILLSLYFGNDFLITRRTLGIDGADEASSGIPEHILQQTVRENATNPFNYQRYHDRCGKSKAEMPGELKTSSEISEVRLWLSTHSRLYGLLRSLRNLLVPNTAGEQSDEQDARQTPERIDREFENAANHLDAYQRRYCYPFSDGEWKTILGPGWMAYAVDSSDVRVFGGLLLVKRVVGLIRDKASEAGAELVVILFPTKESVFYPRVRNSAEIDEEVLRDLASIYENEGILRKGITDYMDSEGIVYVDTLPRLRNAQQQPFFGHKDTHPNHYGNRIIADVVKDLLGEVGRLQEVVQGHSH